MTVTGKIQKFVMREAVEAQLLSSKADVRSVSQANGALRFYSTRHER